MDAMLGSLSLNKKKDELSLLNECDFSFDQLFNIWRVSLKTSKATVRLVGYSINRV